ncbi:MAG: polysaccharide lyase [Akkermansiaceae bacterium]
MKIPSIITSSLVLMITGVLLQACPVLDKPDRGVKVASVLLSEGFDGDLRSGLAKRLIGHKHVTLAKGGGKDSTDGIRVAYVGYGRGSERVVMRYPLGKKVKEATLSFDVKFDEKFQWVLGGKLHGLGPKSPVTGGEERHPERWSARMMFKSKGRCQPYLYDQDETKKWGVGQPTEKPVFNAGQWHHVVFQVRLNDLGKSNGLARVFIDKQLVLEHANVEFRGADGVETQIQQFLFSTFHGGHTAKWSPVDAEGKFTTVYAYYDNFVVRKGLQK